MVKDVDGPALCRGGAWDRGGMERVCGGRNWTLGFSRSCPPSESAECLV